MIAGHIVGNSEQAAAFPKAQGRAQRASGKGHIAVKASGGRTRLQTLFQEGCAKIRLPQTFDRTLEAVMINTAGGLTGGDMMNWQIDAAPETHVDVTTQACEKIYKAASGVATVETRITVGAGARVDWLPQETILFNHAGLSRQLHVDLDENAEFLALEAVLLGRRAMGETMREGRFSDRWRVRRAGQLVHAEDLRLEGDIAALTERRATLDGQVAFATLFYTGPSAEAYLSRVRPLLAACQGGASQWRGKLMVRLVAQDGFSLRKMLIPVLSVLRNGAPVPKVWTL